MMTSSKAYNSTPMPDHLRPETMPGYQPPQVVEQSPPVVAEPIKSKDQFLIELSEKLMKREIDVNTYKVITDALK